MNLQTARDQVSLNLTEDFMSMYNIREDNIDLAINQIYTKLAFNTKTIRNTYTISTVANQASYPLDNEWNLITRVHYDYDSTSGSGDYGEDLEEVSPKEYEGDMEYGTPTKYWLEQPHAKGLATIWFYKIPNTVVTIRVQAIKYPELLSADTDTFKLQQIFDEIIIDGATAKLGAIGKGIPRLRSFESRFQNNMEEARILLSESSLNRTYKVPYRDLGI